MSVLIKGVRLPKNCPMCLMSHWTPGGTFMGCNAVSGKKFAMDDADYRNSVGRPTWCPLVEVPTPHGRLIDADKMLSDESEAFMSAQPKVKDEALRRVNVVVHTKIQMLVIDTPTVIEAEADNGKE